MVSDLRGKPGEVVNLTALRGADVLSLSIRRERVAYDQVKALPLPGELGYICIRQFTENTPTVLSMLLRDLRPSGCAALVIDLRGNQGGLLDKAPSSAELFLKAGTPITQLAHRGGTRETLTSRASGTVSSPPSPCSSTTRPRRAHELLAGAARGHRCPPDRRRTYGKGTVQRVEELPTATPTTAPRATFCPAESPSRDAA